MYFPTRLFTALLVSLSMPVWANLRDDHKQSYPFLAKAIAKCQDEGLSELEVEPSSWDVINHSLDTSAGGQWLNGIEEWQLPFQTLEAPEMLAVWLLPQAEQWHNLKNFYSDLFLAIASSYLARPFERVDIQRLVKLIKSSPQLASVLTRLFQHLPELARYLLRHLVYLEDHLEGLTHAHESGLLTWLSENTNLNSVLKILWQKGHSKLLRTLLSWLLSGPDQATASEAIDELLQQITYHPESIQVLTELDEQGLANQLSVLANAPPNQFQVQEDDLSGLLADTMVPVGDMGSSIEIIDSAESPEPGQPDSSLLSAVYGSLPPHPTTLPLSSSQHSSEAGEDAESPHTPATAAQAQDFSPLTDAEVDLMVPNITNVTVEEACCNTTQPVREPVTLLLYPVRLSDQ